MDSEERLGYRKGLPASAAHHSGRRHRSTYPETRLRQLSSIDPRTPPLCEPGLYAVIIEAYGAGVSTRNVGAWVAALDSQSGISKSQVSLICADIDLQVQAFLNRPLECLSYAYLYLDSTYLHDRLGRVHFLRLSGLPED